VKDASQPRGGYAPFDATNLGPSIPDVRYAAGMCSHTLTNRWRAKAMARHASAAMDDPDHSGSGTHLDRLTCQFVRRRVVAVVIAARSSFSKRSWPIAPWERF
jgi:hypothetical protein